MKIKKKVKIKKIRNIFYNIIGYPRINIEHGKAVEAIERFLVFAKFLLIYQPNLNVDRPMPPTKWFTCLSITVDIFIVIIFIELIVGICSDNLVLLAYLGDVFVGIKNEYALRMLCFCGVLCLGSFRIITCYLSRNGALDWTTVIVKAMVYGWKPEVLHMKKVYCLKWRQISVFVARQIVGTSIISTLVWLICLTYSIYNSKTLNLAVQNPLILTCFLFRQIITTILLVLVIPQVAWFCFLFIIAAFYVIHRSRSVYDELQESLQFESLPASVVAKLCQKNISFLNEFASINRQICYVAYCGYNFVSLAGQVAMLYSYLGLFGMPAADLGLGIIGFNTVFQIGLISYLAAKSLVKIHKSYSFYHRIYQYNFNIEPRLKFGLLYNLDRLSSPFIGIWVGESFQMDNYSFITFLLETCSNMMLIIVTLPALIWR